MEGQRSFAVRSALRRLRRLKPLPASASSDPPPEGQRRNFDCMDCHNRPAHPFLAPDEAVDRVLEERARGSRYRLVKLDIEGNKPAKDAYVYSPRGKVIGTVTSAMWSPSAKASIALASVETPHGLPGEELEVEIYYQRELEWRRVRQRARVVEKVFWDPPRRRLTPPADF